MSRESDDKHVANIQRKYEILEGKKALLQMWEERDDSLFRVVLATRLAQNYTEKVERISEPNISDGGRGRASRPLHPS